MVSASTVKPRSAKKRIKPWKTWKAPTVVSMDKHDYIKRVNEIIHDSSKFEEVKIKAGTEI